MAEIIRVSDTDDSRLDVYLRLRDVSLRQNLETERGIYLAEGEKVVRRSVEAGHRAVSFLMAPRWLDGLSDVLDRTDAPCFVLDEVTIERLTGFHVHRGALAAIERPVEQTADEVLRDARRIVVMEDLADHANVGAIFRSAAALGFDGIVLSPRCADPWYRRAIKTSMGAVFRVPFARVDDWYGLPDLLRRHGVTSLALTLADDSASLDDVDPGIERLALIVGSEGHGLSDRWQSASDLRVRIPMAADIDSLNAAASVAVACWQLRPR